MRYTNYSNYTNNYIDNDLKERNYYNYSNYTNNYTDNDLKEVNYYNYYFKKYVSYLDK